MHRVFFMFFFFFVSEDLTAHLVLHETLRSQSGMPQTIGGIGSMRLAPLPPEILFAKERQRRKDRGANALAVQPTARAPSILIIGCMHVVTVLRVF